MIVNPKVEHLIQLILSKRKDLTREQLMKLIEEKKMKIGSGYLTDMGALYLIASDLNITLEPQEEYLLSQVRAGMKDVDIVAYFLFQTDEKEYVNRKGERKKYRIMYVYYDEIVKVVLWDEVADLPLRLALKPSEKLRLRKCSVRRGRSGNLELHLNNQSSITVEPNHTDEGRERLERITEDISKIDVNRRIHVIKGEVAQPIRTLSYTTKKGERSEAISFNMKDPFVGKTVRVIIWGCPQIFIERIKEGQVLRIIGLNIRKGKYSDFELHGDHNVHIEILGTGRATSKNFLVFSIGTVRDEKINLLLLDKDNGRIYSLQLPESYAERIKRIGTKVRIPQEKLIVKGNSLSIISNEIEILDEIEEEPLNKFRVKIIDLKENMGPVIVEAIALSKSRVQEIKTKSGEIIKRGTLLVGDDTGEAKIYAWRENTKFLEGIMPGERILFFGVIPKKTPYEEEIILEVKEFTQIKRSSQPSSSA